MRVEQERAASGSQRWLQIAVNRCPAAIDAAIRDTWNELPGGIDWTSPMEYDGFAEYTDSEFVDRHLSE